MKVALVGGSSFLAKSLAKKFEYQTQLIVYGRNESSICYNFNNFHCYNYPHIKLEDLSTLLDADIIIFCAVAGVISSRTLFPRDIYALNLSEPIRLIEFLQKEGFKNKIITFGSYFEIGESENKSPYTEIEVATHSNIIRDPYSLSKNLLTRYCFNRSSSVMFTWQHFILPNIFGPNENIERLIPYILINALKNTSLNLTKGNQYRQFCFVEDVATFISKNINSKEQGIFNLAPDNIKTVKEFALEAVAAIENDTGKKIQITFGAKNRDDQSKKFLALNTDKLEYFKHKLPVSSTKEIIYLYLHEFKKSKKI